jgi:hypothetical protein
LEFEIWNLIFDIISVFSVPPWKKFLGLESPLPAGFKNHDGGGG